MSATIILPFFCNCEILVVVHDFCVKLENYQSVTRESGLFVGFCSIFSLS